MSCTGCALFPAGVTGELYKYHHPGWLLSSKYPGQEDVTCPRASAGEALLGAELKGAGLSRLKCSASSIKVIYIYITYSFFKRDTVSINQDLSSGSRHA